MVRFFKTLAIGAIAATTLITPRQTDAFVDGNADMVPNDGWAPFILGDFAVNLTWSIVDDGTLIDPPPGSALPFPAPSTLEAVIEQQLLPFEDDPEFEDRNEVLEIFEDVFERWDIVTGADFTNVTDDGEDWIDTDDGGAMPPTDPEFEDDEGPLTYTMGPTFPNRGDIRISMRPIDGPEGVRVYAYVPQGDTTPEANGVPQGLWGNIILDSADFAPGLVSGQFFFEQFDHYVGKAVGQLLGLVPDCTNSIVYTDGNENIFEPTLDDIRATQWLYGDNIEDTGNSFPTAQLLPFQPQNGPQLFENLSIHRSDGTTDPTDVANNLGVSPTNDVDLFRTPVPAVGIDYTLTVTLTPEGDGVCVADDTSQMNLQLHFYDTDRNFVMTVDANPAGGEEVLVVNLPAFTSGTYTVAVSADNVDHTGTYAMQLYDILFEVEVDLDASATDLDEIVELIEADFIWNTTTDNRPDGFHGESVRVGLVEGFKPNPDHIVFEEEGGDASRIEDVIVWSGDTEPVEDNFSEHATASGGVFVGVAVDSENFSGITYASTMLTGSVARQELPDGSFTVSDAGLYYALFGMADPSLLVNGEVVAEPVRVINESWGSPIADIAAVGTTAIANDALVSMYDVLVVAASGNDGLLNRTAECDLDDGDQNPGVQYRGYKTIASPASSFNVLSVGTAAYQTLEINVFGNIQQGGLGTRVLSFSSKGPIDTWDYDAEILRSDTRPGVHLVAPGVGSALWFRPPPEEDSDDDDICAYIASIPIAGLRLPAIDPDEVDDGAPFDNDFFATTFDGTEGLGGTSFASTLVAGVGSLLIDYGNSEGLSTDPVVIRALMMNSATRLPGFDADGDPPFPQEFPRSDARSYVSLDRAQGAGMVNARLALENYRRGSSDVPFTDPEVPVKRQGSETPGFDGDPDDGRALATMGPREVDALLGPVTWQQAQEKLRKSRSVLRRNVPGRELADKDDPDLGNPTQGGAGSDWSPRVPAFPGPGGVGGGGGGGAGGGVGGGGDPDIHLLITEIMYNPASSSDPAWEYVEVYNAGGMPVDLTGYFFDDEVADQDDALGAPNIAGGVIQPFSTGVLFNADLNSAGAMVNAWGDANWIPVTNWPGLENDGEGIGVWSSTERYNNGNLSRAEAVVGYGVTSPWPEDDAMSSIYLVDLSSNPAMGVNWSLSQIDVDGAYESEPAGLNSATNVGSPGVVVQPSIIITEIMYNPAQAPDLAWEYAEIYNPTNATVDLSGWVFDDATEEQGDVIGSANIAAGTIGPEETAVLFNADLNDVATMTATWGAANWIPVTNWPSLDNAGDIIALWDSYAAYEDEDFNNDLDLREFENTQFFVLYTPTVPWPEDNGESSIYLTDLLGDTSDPGDWASSTVGTDGAYRSERAGDNFVYSVGSPGDTDGILELPVLPVEFIGWDHGMLGQENGSGFLDYLIDTPLRQGESIAITLAWNRTVTVADLDFSDPINPQFGEVIELELEDLNITLYRSDEFGNILEPVDGGGEGSDPLEGASTSNFNNVEHIRQGIPRPSYYVIRISWAGTDYDLFNNMEPANVEYGLAWRVTPDPERTFGFSELNLLLDGWGASIGEDGYDRYVDVDGDFDLDFEDLVGMLDGWTGN